MSEHRVESSDLAQREARYDRSRMADAIRSMPDQIDYALADDEVPPAPPGTFTHVVVSGMGGSALPVEVLVEGLRADLALPITVSRTYRPPRFDEGTLHVVCSFSGNTEETLEALAARPHAATIVLTAGGELARRAGEAGHAQVLLPAHRHPAGFQPRCATGYFVTYLARMLASAGALRPGALKALGGVPGFLRGLEVRAEAESLASAIGDATPVFYADATVEGSMARIAKIKVNENAKRPAFFNQLPEVNHNEMIGFAQPYGRWALIYFRDPEAHPRVHRRFEVMKAVFEREGVKHVSFHEWATPGQNAIQRIFAALSFADWTAFTLALLDGIDPSPVDLVEAFKRELVAI